MKAVIKFFLVLALGILIGLLAFYWYFAKPLNAKMAKINESHLVAQVSLLEQLRANNQEAALFDLNRLIDRELATVFAWTQFKQQPSDAAYRAIQKVANIRRENDMSSYQAMPEIAEEVAHALQLRPLSEIQ